MIEAPNPSSRGLITELGQIVTDENVESIMQAISSSENPQVEALSFLSNGNISFIQKTFNSINQCGLHFPPKYLIPVRKGWINQNSQQKDKLLFKESLNPICYEKSKKYPKNTQINIFGNKLIETRNFFSIRGNPYQPVDAIPQFSKENYKMPPDFRDTFVKENDYHAGLQALDVFDEIEDPDTKGSFSDEQKFSYVKLTFRGNYPKCSGRKPRMLPLFNDDWASCQQDTHEEKKKKKANIPQVTEKMENIEDQCNELNVKIARNKSVYRKLLYGGYEYSTMTPMIAEELDQIYGNRGSFILHLLQLDPEKILPIILKRLKDRMKNLYMQKVFNSKTYATQLESMLPMQRMVYQVNTIKKTKLLDIEVIQCDMIQYPVNQVHILNSFLPIIKSNTATDYECTVTPVYESKFRMIMTELRDPTSRTIDMSYYHAFCIYVAALFISKVCSSDVTDCVSNENVKTAIELGLTDFCEHGYQKIVNLVADSIHSKKTKKNYGVPALAASMEISGRMFKIDLQSSIDIVQLGVLFFKTIEKFAAESESDIPFIKCSIGEGQLQLLTSTNENVVLNI